MAYPTHANSSVTDSITQANTTVIGDSPAIAMGNVYIATSQALSNAAHNATSNQMHSYTVTQASSMQGVSTLLSLDAATVGSATGSLLGGGGLL